MFEKIKLFLELLKRLSYTIVKNTFSFKIHFHFLPNI